MATWHDWALMGAEALGTVGLALVGRRVWAAFRVVGAASLGRFGRGFLLLAASQAAALLLHASVLMAGDVLGAGFDHLDLLFWLYYITLLGGLSNVFWSFGRHPFRWAPAVAPVLAFAGPFLEIVSIVVLFFVVLHAGLNHIARKGTGSGLVAAAFFFVFTAHTLFLMGYAAITPRSWLGELVNLVGVAILYVSVARPRTVPDA